MKKKFNTKLQTVFKIPRVSSSKRGKPKRYSKKVRLSVGKMLVTRNSTVATDEGYESHYEEYQNTGGVLFRYNASNSRDCDGQYSNERMQKLVHGEWETTDESDRDHSAEKAGY